MRPLCPSLLLLLFLAGCSPTTPLFVAHVATHEVVEYKTLKSKRMAAAVEEEGDLLTYSALAIRDAHSPQAEQLYLSGYRDRGLSDEVRAIALYQIGLIYMSRYNDQRDDATAQAYLNRVLDEFPGTRAAERAAERLMALRGRVDEPLQKNARELLVDWKPKADLDLNKPSLDQDMTLLSRRAVLKNRVAEAEELYLLALRDPGVAGSIKEKALYQLGLMYMAADNPRADRDKAITYLRRLLVQYPNGELAGKAARHLDRVLNSPAA
jgi:hypothetical protein